MTIDTQTFIEAVEAGEMTDPGGMTTTRDVADVVPDPYDAVKEQLHALEREGIIESISFGNERVWRVPDDGEDSQVEPTTDRPISTATRAH